MRDVRNVFRRIRKIHALKFVPCSNESNARSAFVSVSYKVTEQWEIAADGRYSRRDFRFTYPVPPDDFLVPATNPFNHLGRPLLVAYDFTRDFGPVVDRGPTTASFISTAVKGILPKG